MRIVIYVIFAPCVAQIHSYNWHKPVHWARCYLFLFVWRIKLNFAYLSSAITILLSRPIHCWNVSHTLVDTRFKIRHINDQFDPIHTQVLSQYYWRIDFDHIRISYLLPNIILQLDTPAGNDAYLQKVFLMQIAWCDEMRFSLTKVKCGCTLS